MQRSLVCLLFKFVFSAPKMIWLYTDTALLDSFAFNCLCPKGFSCFFKRMGWI